MGADSGVMLTVRKNMLSLTVCMDVHGVCAQVWISAASQGHSLPRAPIIRAVSLDPHFKYERVL